MSFDFEDLVRLLAACVAGAVIGFERELHDKPAGLRTNVMICLGAALFTVLSIRVAGVMPNHDPARIAAQVVTGVGFLGAGAILQLRGQIVGLTTAATIWLVASVGMAFGSGEFLLGSAATLLSAGVLLGLSWVEELVATWRTTANLQIEMEPSPELSRAIKADVRELGLYRKSWRVNKVEGSFIGFLEVVGPDSKVDELYKKLMAEPGVKSLQRL
jgi:putative Mg2+ transporter-C (MgtC) family protein